MDREKHGQVINALLKYINKKTSDFVLKGGTALRQCYGLGRFSEDIGLDGKSKGIIALCQSFCDEYGYECRVAKDTDTVKRCMIHYGGEKPLKVEVSLRRKNIPETEITNINGIEVYTINTMSLLKSNAYMGRDKIRDLYDVTFIINNYFDKLESSSQFVLRNALEYKGLEQFDYIVSNQSDELIDNDKLAEDFLKAYEKVGLIMEDSEKEDIQDLSKED